MLNSAVTSQTTKQHVRRAAEACVHYRMRYKQDTFDRWGFRVFFQPSLQKTPITYNVWISPSLSANSVSGTFSFPLHSAQKSAQATQMVDCCSMSSSTWHADVAWKTVTFHFSFFAWRQTAEWPKSELHCFIGPETHRWDKKLIILVLFNESSTEMWDILTVVW